MTDTPPDDWNAYRNYLCVLARQALPRSIREKVDESDVVQDALLQACRNQADFQGNSHAEFLAWLRRILERQILTVCRRYRSIKRDVSREQQIHLALERSSCHIEQASFSELVSPSQKAAMRELMCHVSDSLQQLPPRQREAVELKYLQELSFAEVAEQMDLNRDQVAGLIRRGIKRLYELNVRLN